MEADHVRRFVSDREPQLFDVEGGRVHWIWRLNQNIGAKRVCHICFSLTSSRAHAFRASECRTTVAAKRGELQQIPPIKPENSWFLTNSQKTIDPPRSAKKQ